MDQSLKFYQGGSGVILLYKILQVFFHQKYELQQIQLSLWCAFFQQFFCNLGRTNQAHNCIDCKLRVYALHHVNYCNRKKRDDAINEPKSTIVKWVNCSEHYFQGGEGFYTVVHKIMFIVQGLFHSGIVLVTVSSVFVYLHNQSRAPSNFLYFYCTFLQNW